MANTNKTPEKLYNTFWMIYRNKSKNHPVFPLYLSFKILNLEEGIVELSLVEPIHLMGWKYKGSSHKIKSIDILIDASEHLSLENMVILKSNIHISYFEIDNDNKPSILVSIHYDFEHGQKGHPIYHAQLCCNPVDGRKSQSFKRYEIPCDFRMQAFEHCRIPTASMGLVSALISIFADHNDPIILNELINASMKVKNLPKVFSNKLIDYINNDKKNFGSIHWYRCI